MSGPFTLLDSDGKLLEFRTCSLTGFPGAFQTRSPACREYRTACRAQGPGNAETRLEDGDRRLAVERRRRCGGTHHHPSRGCPHCDRLTQAIPQMAPAVPGGHRGSMRQDRAGLRPVVDPARSRRVPDQGQAGALHLMPSSDLADPVQASLPPLARRISWQSACSGGRHRMALAFR